MIRPGAVVVDMDVPGATRAYPLTEPEPHAIRRGTGDARTRDRLPAPRPARSASALTESGRQAEVVLGDLADEERLREFADRAWNWRERVDIWVNNAGADVLTGNARDWSFDQKLERLWQVDVLATIRLSRLIGQKMLAEIGRAHV